MSDTLWLRIDKQESLKGDLIEITWEPFFQQVEMPVVKEYWKKCAQKAFEFTLQSFREEMEKVKDGGPLDLRRAGDTLFKNFVEQDFYLKYRDHCSEIYISTRMTYVPWELTTDSARNEEPWGIKYAIGNQVRAPMDVKEKSSTFKEVIHVLLIAANVRDDLKYVDREIQEIKQGLVKHRRIQCDILIKNSGTYHNEENVRYLELNYDRVVRQLQNPDYDIIHFAGHIEAPDETELGSALLVGKDELLYSKTIYDNLEGTPFVFLNGCGMPWDKAPLVITHIADGFIFGGARGVLVPRTPIFDDDARRIAVKYYEHILSGETFGEALRLIRKEEYDHAPSRINWLTYVLFGKPSFRLFSLEKEIFLSDSQLRVKVLNKRIFEEQTIALIEEAMLYASHCKADKVESEHLLIAFTKSEILARLYADMAEDDLWRVLKELRLQFDATDTRILEPNTDEKKPVKEELVSAKFQEILKNAHSICDNAQLQKIRPIDLCQALLASDNEKLDKAVKAVAERFHFSTLTSRQALLQTLNEMRFHDKISESLTMNLYTIDGYINENFITEKARTIFAKGALLHSQFGEKLKPEDLFKICSLLPGLRTKKFFEAHQAELGSFQALGEIILNEGILRGGEVDLALTAEALDLSAEKIIKRAAQLARREGTKLDEKHLIRNLIEHVKRHSDDFAPEFLALLEELELDTISW